MTINEISRYDIRKRFIALTNVGKKKSEVACLFSARNATAKGLRIDYPTPTVRLLPSNHSPNCLISGSIKIDIKTLNIK